MRMSCRTGVQFSFSCNMRELKVENGKGSSEFTNDAQRPRLEKDAHHDQHIGQKLSITLQRSDESPNDMNKENGESSASCRRGW
jgi:hypothetical protein